jgi:hypothetical protein
MTLKEIKAVLEGMGVTDDTEVVIGAHCAEHRTVKTVTLVNLYKQSEGGSELKICLSNSEFGEEERRSRYDY